MVKNILLALLCVLQALVFCARMRVEHAGIFGESRKAFVLGQDGVTPVPIDDATTMWTFGDTMLGTWKGEVSSNATFTDRVRLEDMISNSLAFSNTPTPDNVETLSFRFYMKNGKVAQFLKLKNNEKPDMDRLWAVDGIRLGNSVYVYYLPIQITDKKMTMAVRMKGVGLARWEVPAGWKPGDDVDFRRLPDLFRGEGPAFGDCVIQKNGYLYLIGHYTSGLSAPVKIARVLPENIAQSRSYQFLCDNGRWVDDVAKASAFLGDVMGECSISYNPASREFIIIYCQIWTGRIMMVRFADFSGIAAAEKVTVYEPPKLYTDGGKTQAWYYSGKEIFSWSRTIYAVYINPVEYQPYLIRIKLE